MNCVRTSSLGAQKNKSFWFADSMSSPKVSVIIITFNHENYIRECLEGALNQDTPFEYEILVADDASTDRTSEIVAHLSARSTSVSVRHLRAEKNRGLMGNVIEALPQTRGKYLAICEGDDYWCDQRKLRKQVAVLEEHPDRAMCTHECFKRQYPPGTGRNMRKGVSMVLRDIQLFGIRRGSQLGIEFLRNRERFWDNERASPDRRRTDVIDMRAIYDTGFLPASPSIVMRRDVVFPVPDCFRISDGHHHMSIMLAALNGGVVHLKDVMAVKRDQESSFTKSFARKNANKKRSMVLETNEKIKRWTCLLDMARTAEDRDLLKKMIAQEKRKYHFSG